MLIDPHFVVLNVPKTGSTFVRTMMKRLHDFPLVNGKRRRLVELGLYRPRRAELFFGDTYWPEQPASQHGTFDQIPRQYRGRPVASVLRNPFDWVVSNYEFGWWKDNIFVSEHELKRVFPSFPELTMGQFIEFQMLSTQAIYAQGKRCEHPIGEATAQVARLLCAQPERTLREMWNNTSTLETFTERLAATHILRNERLNDDLVQFLSEMDYSEQQISFIRQGERVQPAEGTGRGSRLWQTYYTERELRRLCYLERHLLELMASLNIGEPETWPTFWDSP